MGVAGISDAAAPCWGISSKSAIHHGCNRLPHDRGKLAKAQGLCRTQWMYMSIDRGRGLLLTPFSPRHQIIGYWGLRATAPFRCSDPPLGVWGRSKPGRPSKNESLHQPCYHRILSGGKAHVGHTVDSCVPISTLASSYFTIAFNHPNTREGQSKFSKSLNHVLRPHFLRHLLPLLPPPVG